MVPHPRFTCIQHTDAEQIDRSETQNCIQCYATINTAAVSAYQSQLNRPSVKPTSFSHYCPVSQPGCLWPDSASKTCSWLTSVAHLRTHSDVTPQWEIILSANSDSTRLPIKTTGIGKDKRGNNGVEEKRKQSTNTL